MTDRIRASPKCQKGCFGYTLTSVREDKGNFLASIEHTLVLADARKNFLVKAAHT